MVEAEEPSAPDARGGRGPANEMGASGSRGVARSHPVSESLRRELGAFGAGIAMKLAANRGLRDSGDTEGLMRTCGVSSVEQAQAIYETYHAQGVLSPRA